jgi:hypothetical protein
MSTPLASLASRLLWTACLAGCATTAPPCPPPVVVERPRPAVPPPPPEGYFVRRMEALLDLISTPAPGETSPGSARPSP